MPFSVPLPAQPPTNTINYAAIAVAIWRQVSAQRRQDAAQRWQWSWSCLSHSAAQRSQASAQTLHIWPWRSELRAMKREHRSQVSAQSRHRLIHSAIICTISLSKQAVAQFSQSRKQSRHAWMQVSSKDWWDWDVVITFFRNLYMQNEAGSMLLQFYFMKLQVQSLLSNGGLLISYCRDTRISYQLHFFMLKCFSWYPLKNI